MSRHGYPGQLGRIFGSITGKNRVIRYVALRFARRAYAR